MWKDGEGVSQRTCMNDTWTWTWTTGWRWIVGAGVCAEQRRAKGEKLAEV